MTTRSDVFARFVDLVAASLDDDAVPTDELADRLFLSRSQLDRVVSAAAGEAPGRFRRRILLERAAYRLGSADVSVLDIAVEAGYSSHEAFTRAFQRAYGAAPSAWRGNPGAPRLGTRSGVHFYPPAGLRLAARAQVTSMDLVRTMTEHHIWLVGRMIDRASRLTDRQLDTPIELSVEGVDREPTLRSLLSRLVGQLDMWNQSVASRPYDFAVEDRESLDSMTARLAVAGPIFLEHVVDACRDGSFDDTFVDATSEPPEFFTYGGMVAHVLTYAAHRRTLVAGALASSGVTDLEDDPLAWSPMRPDGPTTPAQAAD